MPLLHRRCALSCALMLLLPVLSGPVLAQSFPADKPIKLVVGFPPGSGPDVVARTLGQKLGEVLKTSIVIDNRAGAGGQIAAQAVAKSPADGLTLLLGEVGSIAIAPPAFSKLPYDPAKELAIVSEVVRSDFLLVVPANSPSKTVAEFVSQSKAKKDNINFATFGAGTPGHFGAEILAETGGFKVEPVHYRATGDAVTAIVVGDVAGAFVTTSLGAAQVKGGKVRALATTAPQRSSQLPDVPTFKEAGSPAVDFSAWFAVFAPTGTPTASMDILNKAVVAAVQSPEVKQRLVEAGFSVTGTSRADAEKMVKAEASRWSGIVRKSGFKGD